MTTTSLSAEMAMRPSIRAVCNFLNVTEDELRGASRRQRLVESRQIVCWFARRYTKLSYGEIGEVIGSRDHTTILHGVKKVERIKVSDKWIGSVIDCLDSEIQSETKLIIGVLATAKDGD